MKAETLGSVLYFVNLDPQAEPLTDFLGGLVKRCEPLDSANSTSFDRKIYDIACNWKVFIDNYLDGGYHVPHLHKALSSVLDYKAIHDRKRRPLLPAIEPNGDFVTRMRHGRNP